MHSGAQDSGMSFGNTRDQVGGPSKSERSRKTSDDRDDLPFQPERRQGFINRSLFVRRETPARDADVLGRSITSGSDLAPAQRMPLSRDTNEAVSEQCLRTDLWTHHRSHNAGFQIDGPVAKRHAVFVGLLHEAQPHAGSFLADASNEVRSEILHKAFAGPQRERSYQLFEVDLLSRA